MTNKLILWLSLLSVVSTSQVFLDKYGGYRGVVVKISEDVEEAQCGHIIQNLKVISVTESMKLFASFSWCSPLHHLYFILRYLEWFTLVRW